MIGKKHKINDISSGKIRTKDSLQQLQIFTKIFWLKNKDLSGLWAFLILLLGIYININCKILPIY
jgi:hypothetical protein